MISTADAYLLNRIEHVDGCRTIYDLLLHHAIGSPEVCAVVDGKTRLTYRQLLEVVDQTAEALIQRGVRPGDRIATLSPPSACFFVTFLASVSIGATWLGLNPRHQAPEYDYVLGDAEPKLIFSPTEFEGRAYAQLLRSLSHQCNIVELSDLSDPIRSLSAFFNRDETGAPIALGERRHQVRPGDIAVIVYTSGTTGQPKGAMLSHGSVVQAARENARWMGDGLGSVMCASPINHVGGVNAICMNVLAHGGKIVFSHRVDLDVLVDLARAEEMTYLPASPTSLAMLESHPATGPAFLAGFRLIVLGGAPTPRHMLEGLLKSGSRIFSVYGQTETCAMGTITDEGASLSQLADTIGRPMRGVSLRIVGEDGQELDVGETGEIQIASPYNMSGYFRKLDATKDTITSDGYVQTGDLGAWTSDGTIRFNGRLKHMFKSGGYNVYPSEVEAVLTTHPDVDMAAVLAVPHPVFLEVGHAFVATRDPELGAEDLDTYLRTQIANYKIPKSFTFERTLPQLPGLKVDRKALQARLATLPEASK